MPILKEIKENLKAISSVETIANVYQETASIRMNQIRQGVLINREFIEELSRVYAKAKNSYIVSLKKTGEVRKKELLAKKTKDRVVIFLSSNERFYGALMLNIWKEVLNYLDKNKSDLVVVGRTGKYLAEQEGLGKTMLYFELQDDKPEKEKVRGIIEFAKNYKEILVFHGRFQTILSQEIAHSRISGQIPQEKEFSRAKNYLLEPSPEAVLEFFEMELLSAFFNQAILEHQLSKYATRMIAMHQASENAKEEKKELEGLQKKMKRQMLNKKQIELFSASQLWE